MVSPGNQVFYALDRETPDGPCHDSQAGWTRGSGGIPGQGCRRKLDQVKAKKESSRLQRSTEAVLPSGSSGEPGISESLVCYGIQDGAAEGMNGGLRNEMD